MNRINTYLYSYISGSEVATILYTLLLIYRYLINHSTLSLKAPSLPALTFGLLCTNHTSVHTFIAQGRGESILDIVNQFTYQITANSKTVGAALPVSSLITGCELPIAQDCVSLLLLLGRELLVDGTTVDQQRHSGLRVFLHGYHSNVMSISSSSW